MEVVRGGTAYDAADLTGPLALVLGSETNKVLTHSSIPVLVFR